MPHEKGDILYNRYLIENIIAQGGMGAVYLAFDQNLSLQVAVKENLVVTEESSRQFHREATLLGGLKHSNLPRVTDNFIIPDQGEYLVMDYIDGSDLRKSMNDPQPLPVEKVVQIGATICDALAYLHNHQPPIIHRDIKPGNIKVTSTGQIILVDFGLAKVEVEGQATATGAQSLTPGYAPPEQYGKGTDARSDIYGLGATLYAIITNTIPEDGIARLVGAAELTPIRKLRPEVPESVANAIEKAISIQKDNRFNRIEAFKAALTGKPYEEPVSNTIQAATIQPPTAPNKPGPATNVPDNKKEGKKSPFLWTDLSALIAVGFLVLIAGILLLVNFFLTSSHPAVVQPTPPPPVRIIERTETKSAVVSIKETRASTPIIATETPQNSLKPTLPAVVAPTTSSITATGPAAVKTDQIAFTSERSGNPQIWIMNADGTNPQKITNMTPGACQPAWSPDGQKLIFVSPCSGLKDKYPGSSLFMINADGTGLNPLPSVPGGDFDPSWSPNGKQIVFISIRSGFTNIYLMNLDDSSITRITSHTQIIERHPVWSPDGQWIAYQSSQNNQNQIWLIPYIQWNQPKDYTSQDLADFMPSWSPDGKTLVFSQGEGLPWLATKPFNNDPAARETRISDTRPASQPIYSHDGTKVIFVSRTSDKNDIFQLDLGTKNVSRLTNDPAADYDPAWRPSGQ